tara:strand:+ start:6782 stop:9526 length:2745 start_codon:yes stop_codon:yes gene_type:complete
MGSFSTGIGLISGFDSATIIEQMLLGESRGRFRLQSEIATLQSRQSSMLELNARLLGLQSAASLLSSDATFGAMQIASSRADVLTATVAGGTPAGDWSFIVESLAARHQVLAGGASSRDAALGLESFSIEFGGTLNPTTRLDELNGGVGIDRGRMELVLGTGVGASTYVVDCRSIASMQDVIAAIESVDARLQVSIDDTSLRIETLDGSSISFSSLDGATTAEDLGLVGDGSAGVLEGDAMVRLDGSTLLRWIDDGNGVLIEEGTPDLRITSMDGRVFDVDVPADATCIQDVLDAVASAVDATGAANDGAVVARVHADGLRLEVVDQTGGIGVLRIESTGGNPHAADDLGLEGDGVGGIIVGDRLLAGLDSVLISNLNGGNGVPPGSQMRFRYAANETTDFFIGPDIESVGQLIADLNRQVVENDHTFRFELNDAANGIRVIADDSSNLNFAGELAESLGLLGLGVGVVEGANLQHRYIDESRLLSTLNGGQGVDTGSFSIRDATGQTATIVVDSNVRTVADLMALVESKGLAVSVGVNATGDGLRLESTASEAASSFTLRIDSAGGSTASDLRLIGEATEVHGSGAWIDGRWEREVAVDSSTTLQELQQAILDAGVPISCSLIQSGTGSDAWRLAMSSDRIGAGGAFRVDGRFAGGGVMQLDDVVRGEDARVVLGDDPADGQLLWSSSNTLSDVIEGLVIDLHAASPGPVTLSISRDASSARNAVESFVEAYNQVVDLLRSVDSYDAETGARGALLGDSTVARVDRSLSSLALQRLSEAQAVEGYQGLWELGVRMGSSGRLEVDAERLDAVLADDPTGVEAAFLRDDGIQRGFAVRFEELVSSLTDAEAGALGIAGERFQSRIELANERIELIDRRIEARRVILVERFAAMERALSALQSQNSALLSFQSSML